MCVYVLIKFCRKSVIMAMRIVLNKFPGCASPYCPGLCVSGWMSIEWLWSGSLPGCILHSRRIAPGDTTARQHSENRHTYNTHMNTVGGSLRQRSKYFIRQESVLWSSIPASSCLACSGLQTRANQIQKLGLVKNKFFSLTRRPTSFWFDLFLHFELKSSVQFNYREQRNGDLILKHHAKTLSWASQPLHFIKNTQVDQCSTLISILHQCQLQ